MNIITEEQLLLPPAFEQVDEEKEEPEDKKTETEDNDEDEEKAIAKMIEEMWNEPCGCSNNVITDSPEEQKARTDRWLKSVKAKRPVREDRRRVLDMKQTASDYIRAWTKITASWEKQILAKLKTFDSVVKPDSDSDDNKSYILKRALTEDNVDVLSINVEVGTKQLKKGFNPVATAAAKFAEARMRKQLIARGEDVVEVILSKGAITDIVKAREVFFPEIVENTNAIISRTVTEGISKGRDLDLITSQLKDRLQLEKVGRAKLIARTETVSVTNDGELKSAQGSGVFKTKTWITQRDGDVREEHQLMDGETVKLDKSYSNGSDFPDDFNERCFSIYN
jgi:hypothetical protein